MNPSGGKTAAHRVSCGGEVRPRAAVKGDFIPTEYFDGQSARQSGSDAAVAVFGQDVDSDLPHIWAIGGGARESDQFSRVVGSDSQNIQPLSFFAERVAPFGQIESAKIVRAEEPGRIGAGEGL